MKKLLETFVNEEQKSFKTAQKNGLINHFRTIAFAAYVARDLLSKHDIECQLAINQKKPGAILTFAIPTSLNRKNKTRIETMEIQYVSPEGEGHGIGFDWKKYTSGDEEHFVDIIVNSINSILRQAARDSVK